MIEHDWKERIDSELNELTFQGSIQTNSLAHRKRKSPAFMKYAAAAAILAITGTTVFAGYQFIANMHVNKTELPELDALKITACNPLKGEPDEYGFIEQSFTDYDEIQEQLGVSLLDSPLAENNSYMMGTASMDSEDYLGLTLENYILGDVSFLADSENEGEYHFKSGTEYTTPVRLSIQIARSQKQAEIGLGMDFLGYYDFIENYTSAQGYKINIVQETVGTTDTELAPPPRMYAGFVADGICYLLDGVVPLDTLKEIVDSMQ